LLVLCRAAQRFKHGAGDKAKAKQKAKELSKKAKRLKVCLSASGNIRCVCSALTRFFCVCSWIHPMPRARWRSRKSAPPLRQHRSRFMGMQVWWKTGLQLVVQPQRLH
jgi:hypothetical protein